MTIHMAWSPVPSNRGKGLQVLGTHKARAKESPGGQDMETDEKLPRSNDLGRFQGVYMGSKQHHKIDEIAKVCS
ncbi:hypothetical protein TNCV_373021 [Trichonephila clavipes]|nr:hypothetical protein TNCV_373021 [Trichonephila clavipes]